MRNSPRIPPKGDFVSAVSSQMDCAQEFMDLINEDIGLKVVKSDAES